MDEQRIKILFVINSLGYGGRENVVISLCNNLPAHLFDVHLLVFARSDNEQLAVLHTNVTVHNLNISNHNLERWRIMFVWFKMLGKLTAIFTQVKPRIVHTHLLFHWLLMLALALRKSRIGVTHFQTIHTSGLYYAQQGFLNFVRLNTERLATRISRAVLIAVSDESYNKIRLLFSNKTIRIYNGIDTRKFTKRPAEKDPVLTNIIAGRCCFTYVSRLDTGKNHVLLLDAWRLFITAHPLAVLMLAGDGPLMEPLKNKVNQTGIGSSVIFLGDRKDIFEILNCSDAALFPSLFEGFSLALIEKMAIGLPVIVSDITAFEGIVSDNSNGLLFEKHSAQSLSNKMEILYTSKSKREQLGAAASNSVQRFSTLQMMNSHITIYKDAIS